MGEDNPIDRHLRLPGTINMRDMGGYPTTCGGRVKRSRLFRSGHLAHAEPDACKTIADLGIELVCDFRIQKERDEHPNQYAPDHEPATRHLPIWPWKAPGSDVASQKLLRGEITMAEAAGYLGSGYREFVRHQHDRFSGVFLALAEQAHGNALLHCSAGKDRTGIAAALVLHALGVDRQITVEDYLLTGQGHGAASQTWHYVDIEFDNYDGTPMCSRNDMFVLYSAHPAKINAAFDEMEQVAGSVDGYIRDTLGVTDEMRRALQHHYVEPA